MTVPGPRDLANDSDEEQCPLGTLPFKLLTPIEVAEVLGIGRSTVYELLAAGDIRSIPIGRSRRVPLRCVEDFVTTRLAEAQES